MKMDVSRSSSGTEDTYNLNFTVTGAYARIAEFITDIEFMDMLEEKMNKNYKFSIDTSNDFIEEQELMIETRTILAYIFLNYWATEIQKEKVNIKFKKDIEDAEKQKRDLYNVDILKNKKQLKENIGKEQENAMVIYKKENFITKIFNTIKKFFGMKH